MSPTPAPRARWRFLDDFPPPSDTEQRRLTLECAAARTLYRVAILRMPRLPPPVLEQAKRLGLKLRMPISVTQLVPHARALWADDPDAQACDQSLAWIDQQPDLSQARGVVLRARQRWHKARACVVAANLLLAAAIVRKRFFYTPMSSEDLLQEAVFGLSIAADRFDPNYGVKFSTYASWWIRHSTQRAVHNTMRVVRLPAHVCESLSRYAVALHELGDDASESALLEHTGFSADKLHQIAHIYKTQGAGPVSLDEPVPGLDQPIPRMDQLLDDRDLEAEISQEQQDAQVRSMILRLPERKRLIMEQRYGFTGEEQTLAQVGRVLSVSRERVRQIEKITLRELAAYAEPSMCPTSRM